MDDVVKRRALGTVVSEAMGTKRLDELGKLTRNSWALDVARVKHPENAATMAARLMHDNLAKSSGMSDLAARVGRVGEAVAASVDAHARTKNAFSQIAGSPALRAAAQANIASALNPPKMAALSAAARKPVMEAMVRELESRPAMVMPPPVNPMPALLRELLEVTQQQAAEIAQVRDQAEAAATEEAARSGRADRREHAMLRLTIASLIVAVISVVVAVVAIVA